MKRYYFDLADGGWEPDTVGIELPDDQRAEHEAIRFAGEVMWSEPGRLGRGAMQIRVHDADHTVSFCVDIALQPC